MRAVAAIFCSSVNVSIRKAYNLGEDSRGGRTISAGVKVKSRGGGGGKVLGVDEALIRRQLIFCSSVKVSIIQPRGGQ